MSGHDVIGDVHGEGDGLGETLKRLGYNPETGDHPDGRKIIYLGDYIDRGPQQQKALEIVQSTISHRNAQAIMGNHEFNAILYAMESSEGVASHIRPHSERNNEQHRAFLREFPFGTDKHRKMIDWLKTLPVYLDLEGFRAIHACWSEEDIARCAPHLTQDARLTESSYLAYDRGKEDPFYKAIEILLKGPECRLPEGTSFRDTGGHSRTRSRIHWFEEFPEFPHGAIDQRARSIPADLFKQSHLETIRGLHKKFNYAAQKPLFFRPL